jgi:pseudaminic acid biosynthesis-associated methylase
MPLLTMAEFTTEQERFWAGDFGNAYTERSLGEKFIRSNVVLFKKILARTESVGSVIEFGSNAGLNLIAIKRLLPRVDMAAIELNDSALEQLRTIADLKVYAQSILEFDAPRRWDLVLIKGVLIHIDPNSLAAVYERLYRASGRYICLAEYYNPSPVEISYQGHRGKLFKRDFAGEMMDKYSDLTLVDYGFVYHRDPQAPQDDVTWFLLEKKRA